MRDDLKLAAYAVACGFTLHTEKNGERGAEVRPRHFVAGVPHDGLQFTLGPVHVWQTARGWRVAKLEGDRYPPAVPEDFHRSLLPALEKARGLALVAEETRPADEGPPAAVRHFVANLGHAIAEGERVTIGGGVFDREELREVLRALKPAAA
jgi:hypothetical protein